MFPAGDDRVLEGGMSGGFLQRDAALAACTGDRRRHATTRRLTPSRWRVRAGARRRVGRRGTRPPPPTGASRRGRGTDAAIPRPSAGRGVEAASAAVLPPAGRTRSCSSPATRPTGSPHDQSSTPPPATTTTPAHHISYDITHTHTTV